MGLMGIWGLVDSGLGAARFVGLVWWRVCWFGWVDLPWDLDGFDAAWWGVVIAAPGRVAQCCSCCFVYFGFVGFA